MKFECISIELTNRCDKACAFCYNRSRPNGETLWTANEVIRFLDDCVANGTKSVSFGGGEPLLFPSLYEVLSSLKGQMFRSITTNGLALGDRDHFSRLVAAAPDKVHLSIHQPNSEKEVGRVIQTVLAFEAAGIASGVNLLVSATGLDAAAIAAQRLKNAGIDNRRVIYIPHRYTDTPTPKQIAAVAAGPFQSPSCLTACGKSARFCSISWDRNAAWCSYTRARRSLTDLSYSGLEKAMATLDLVNCNTIARL